MGLRRCLFTNGWEDDFKNRSSVEVGLYQDVTTPLPDEVEGQEEAQSGSALREADEWLEDPAQLIFGDALSCIRHPDVYRGIRHDLNRNDSIGPRRFDSIDEKIHNGMLEIGLIGPDPGG